MFLHWNKHEHNHINLDSHSVELSAAEMLLEFLEVITAFLEVSPTVSV